MLSLIGQTFNVILISYVHLRAGIALRGSESSSQGGEISEAESGYSLSLSYFVHIHINLVIGKSHMQAIHNPFF